MNLVVEEIFLADHIAIDLARRQIEVDLGFTVSLHHGDLRNRDTATWYFAYCDNLFLMTTYFVNIHRKLSASCFEVTLPIHCFLHGLQLLEGELDHAFGMGLFFYLEEGMLVVTFFLTPRTQVIIGTNLA